MAVYLNSIVYGPGKEQHLWVGGGGGYCKYWFLVCDQRGTGEEQHLWGRNLQ